MNILCAAVIGGLVFISILLAAQRGNPKHVDHIRRQSDLIEEQRALIETISEQRDRAIALAQEATKP